MDHYSAVHSTIKNLFICIWLLDIVIKYEWNKIKRRENKMILFSVHELK
jgi:hypothetical protein